MLDGNYTSKGGFQASKQTTEPSSTPGMLPNTTSETTPKHLTQNDLQALRLRIRDTLSAAWPLNQDAHPATFDLSSFFAIKDQQPRMSMLHPNVGCKLPWDKHRLTVITHLEEPVTFPAACTNFNLTVSFKTLITDERTEVDHPQNQLKSSRQLESYYQNGPAHVVSH